MKKKSKLLIAFGLLLSVTWLHSPVYAAIHEERDTDLQQQNPTDFYLKGRVTDENGEPIIGATIRLKDMNIGTVTDADGYYSLNFRVKPTAILASYLGYLGRNIQYTGQTVIDIALKEDTKLLEEVVVTGYQTISKDRATGAFAIVNNQKLEQKITPNLTTALEGLVAGVNTFGGEVVIRGRSTVSLNVGTNPLLVIDGLPTERSMDDININDVENLTILKDAAATSIYGSRAANGVIVITTKSGEKGKVSINFTADWTWKENPSLHDYRLASTSTYIDYEQEFWRRAAEKGYGGNIDQYVIAGNTGSNSTASYFSPLETVRLALAEGRISQSDYDATVQSMRNNDFRQEYMDQAWCTPFRQNYNLSISNGSDRQNTYASFNYVGDALQMKTDENQTLKANIKTTQKINKWLSVDLGLDAQYGTEDGTIESYKFQNMNERIEPYNRILNANGNRNYMPYTYYLGTSGVGSIQFMSSSSSQSFTPQMVDDLSKITAYDPFSFNVLDELDGRNTVKKKWINTRSFARINAQITKDLKFSTSFDYELSDKTEEYYNAADSYYMRVMRNRYISRSGTAAPYTYSKNIPDGGFFYQKETSKNNYTFRNQLDYRTTISKTHSISALAGVEMRQNEIPVSTSAKYFGYNPQTLSSTTLLSSAPSIITPGYTSYMYNTTVRMTPAEIGNASLSYTKHRFLSFYGTGSYTYKDLYTLSGSVRVDQADLFGTDPKYRYRPLWSIGGNWNLSNESFMEDIEWIDLLSVKGSYGVTGNVDQSSSPYTLITLNTSTNSLITPTPYAALSGVAPNPQLRWEKTSSYALGFDFSVLKGLLNGKIESYYKYSDDLLVNVDIPRSSGFTSAVINNGAISNKGIEITLSSPWFNQNGWKLTSTFVYGYNHNRVEKVNRKPVSAGSLIKTPYSYYEEGRPYNALYAYHYEGLTTEGTDYQKGIPVITKKDGTPLATMSPTGTLTVASESTIDPSEAIYMGSLDPLWNGSFTQGIQYKNIELSAMLVFYGGHKLRKPSYDLSVGSSGAPFQKMPEGIENAWSPLNPDGTSPKTGIYYPTGLTTLSSLSEYWRYSDVHVVKGDMLRLRNITLSYSLPGKYAKAARLQKVRVSAQANNLWFWSAAGGGLDPETYTGKRNATTVNGELRNDLPTRNAIDWTLPSQASYLLRLEVTF